MSKELSAHYPEHNHIFQFTRTHDTPSPLHLKYYSEIVYSVSNGFLAKNAFIESFQKHPTRNLFVTHRTDLGDMVFTHDEIPKEVYYRDWMDKAEEDAKAELFQTALDPASAFDELIPNAILRF